MNARTADKRRIGVIGVGFGLQVHVPGFRSEGWDVVAVQSRNPERARKAAQEAGVPDVHTDPYELIGRDDLHAVAIATPPAPHHDLAIAALKAGKHVLCEKPFALSASQAKAMRDAADRSKLTAMVAHEFRNTPQRAYNKQLLGEGYVGEFNLCTIELSMDRAATPKPPPLPWGAQASQGGGLLGALGSHYIDGLRYWFGDIATVRASVWRSSPDFVDPATGKPAKSDTDDSFSFTVTFKNGGTATMSASSAVKPGRGARIAVMGSQGTLYAEQPGPNPMEDGFVLGGRGGEALKRLETPAKYTPFTDKRDPRLMAFRLLVRDFTQGIDEGTSPAPNFTDAWRCQQVLDAVRVSSENGTTIALG
jgi:predicted dehydrogenase